MCSKGDYDALSEEVRQTNWDEVFSSKKLDDRWDTFKTKYTGWIDKFVPTQTIKTGRRHKPPWTSYRSVKQAKRKKRKAAIVAKKSGLHAHQSTHEDEGLFNRSDKKGQN